MKKLLLATAGVAALATSPALASDEHDGGSGIRYHNNIDTSVVTDVTYTKDVALRGTVRIDGDIDIDSSAVAVTDAKQLLAGNIVNYREENELNAENGFVDPIFGPGWSEAGDDPNDLLIDGMMQPQIRAGFFAPIVNTVGEFELDSSGNLGVNLAAGYFNMQMNAATLAVSSDANEDADGGWAEASTTSLQSLLGVRQAATPGFATPGDDPDQGGDNNNFRDRNTVLGGSVNGSGNIGVNAAAGTFNQQANLMTLAVATDSVLAEANAGLIQSAFLSSVEQQDSINVVAGPTVAGASGNIGVNFAAGVGNQQLNSLTIASSQGAADGNGNGGGGDPS